MSDARSTEELVEATSRGVRWITLARICIEVLSLGSMVVLARLIPPAAWGQYAIAAIIQELALSIPGEGVGSALVQRTSIRREHLQSGLAMSLLLAVVLGVLTLVAAELVVQPVFGGPTADLVRLMTPMYLIAALGVVPLARLRRRLDFRTLGLIDISAAIVRTVVALTLATAVGLDAAAPVVGGLAAITTATLIALVVAPSPPPRLRRGPVRDILGYGAFASLASISFVGFRNADYAIVGARLGTFQGGLYWRAYTLAVEYQKKVSVIMTQIAFPVLSRSQNVDDLHAMRRRMVRLLTCVMFPVLAMLAVTAPVVIPFMFGPAWSGSVGPAQVLAIGGAATLVLDAAGAAIMAMGRARAVLGFGVGHFVVYAGGVYLVAPHGILAVAAVAATAHTAFLGVAYAILVRGGARSVVHAVASELGPAVCAAGALVAAALPAFGLLEPAGGVGRFAAAVAVGAAAYAACLRVCFPAAWRDLLALARRVAPAGLVLRLQRRRAYALPELRSDS